MSILVHIPSTLRAECGDASEICLAGDNVGAVLEQIEQSYPALYRSVCDETGAVRRHVNLFVNSSFVRRQDGLETALQDGDILTIMPAVSGG